MVDITELLIEIVNSYYSPQWDEEFVEDVGKILQKHKVYSPDDIPTKHGRWIEWEGDVLTCSNCKHYWIQKGDQYDYRYCPYCGFKMVR